MQELEGKVAVVTGAGSGIGRALAERLAAEGMRVALADLDDGALARAEETLVAGGAPRDGILTQRTDVRLEADVDALADLVFATWDQVDVLCNNAGVYVGGLLWDRPAADLEFVLGVNLWGILHGIRAFVPRMRVQDTEGHIVNTCSILGLLGGTGPYAVSKFAALAATESLANGLVNTGSKLRVTALCPGMVHTNLDTTSLESRPAELTTAVTEDLAFEVAVLAELLGEGIDPTDVAGMVVDAIRAERFLVLTHPHHAEAIRLRAEQLIAGQLPDQGDPR